MNTRAARKTDLPISRSLFTKNKALISWEFRTWAPGRAEAGAAVHISKGEVAEVPSPRCCFLNHFHSPGVHMYSSSHIGNSVALFQNACYLLNKSDFNMDCFPRLLNNRLLSRMARFWSGAGFTPRFLSTTSLNMTGCKAGHLFFVLKHGPHSFRRAGSPHDATWQPHRSGSWKMR